MTRLHGPGAFTPHVDPRPTSTATGNKAFLSALKALGAPGAPIDGSSRSDQTETESGSFAPQDEDASAKAYPAQGDTAQPRGHIRLPNLARTLAAAHAGGPAGLTTASDPDPTDPASATADGASALLGAAGQDGEADGSASLKPGTPVPEAVEPPMSLAVLLASRTPAQSGTPVASRPASKIDQAASPAAATQRGPIRHLSGKQVDQTSATGAVPGNDGGTSTANAALAAMLAANSAPNQAGASAMGRGPTAQAGQTRDQAAAEDATLRAAGSLPSGSNTGSSRPPQVKSTTGSNTQPATPLAPMADDGSARGLTPAAPDDDSVPGPGSDAAPAMLSEAAVTASAGDAPGATTGPTQQVLAALRSLGLDSPDTGVEDGAAPMTAVPHDTDRPTLPAAPLGSVTIQLQPAHLGAVEVTLQRQGGKLAVAVKVADSHALRTIEKDRGLLEGAVMAAGGTRDALVMSLASTPGDASASAAAQPGQQPGTLADTSQGGEARREHRPEPANNVKGNEDEQRSAEAAAPARVDRGLYL